MGTGSLHIAAAKVASRPRRCMASSLEQRVPLVDQVLFENVDRLPDQARYQPLGRKILLRRIGLRCPDAALFSAPRAGSCCRLIVGFGAV
jgi:hypothetical protein